MYSPEFHEGPHPEPNSMTYVQRLYGEHAWPESYTPLRYMQPSAASLAVPDKRQRILSWTPGAVVGS